MLVVTNEVIEMYKKSILMLLLLTLAACGTPTGQVVAEDELVLGGLFGLTGYAAFAGEGSRDGFIMAIEDSGLDVKYYVEDYNSDMTTTVTSAMKLIEVDEADVIIGPEWEFGAPVSHMATEEVLFITPWMVLDIDWAEPEYFLSAMPKEKVFAKPFAEYMAEVGVETIVIVHSIDDFAITVTRDMKEVLEAAGIEVIDTLAIDSTAGDYRTELTKIKQRNPDAVYSVIATDKAQVLFAKQTQEQGLEQQLYIHYARGESDGFLKPAAEAAEGVIFASPKEFHRMSVFKEKFQERYGREPVAISAATAYDMTTLVLQAVKEGATTAEEVHEFLMQLEEYEGYSGIIEFEDGFIKSGEAVIKKIENGERVVIE